VPRDKPEEGTSFGCLQKPVTADSSGLTNLLKRDKGENESENDERG